MCVSVSEPAAKFLKVSQLLRVKHFHLNSLLLVGCGGPHSLENQAGTFLYCIGPYTVKAQLLVQKRAAES